MNFILYDLLSNEKKLYVATTSIRLPTFGISQFEVFGVDVGAFHDDSSSRSRRAVEGMLWIQMWCQEVKFEHKM